MITTARRPMYDALKSLWKTSFGDDLTYAGQIIDNLPPEQILVSLDGNKVQSMLCWLPIEFTQPDGEPILGAYMFGFNTHPSCRGKGVGGVLLEEFHQYMFAKGIRAIALAPANEGLFGYYERFEYQTVFHVKRVEVTAEEIPTAANPCVLLSRSLDTMVRRRQQHFGSRFYGRWGSNALRFLGEECQFRNGKTLRVGTVGVEGYLVYTPLENDTVIVSEFAIPPQNAADTLAALHQRLHAGKYILRVPVDYPIQYKGTDLPFVMVRWYDKEKQASLPNSVAAAPYFAFILD